MTEKINLRYVVFLAATAGLGGILFGFDIAIITGAGPFLTLRFHLSDLSLGWAFSSLLFGCVAGSIILGRLTDRYGRKRLLLWVAALFALTSVATGLAPDFRSFIVARFIGGLAVGGVSLISPMYVAEVSPPSLRGRMGTLYQLSIVAGGFTSYCINYLMRDIGPDNWRWMFITGVAPSALFFVMLLFAPETPRYLVMIGKYADAQRILTRIAGPASSDFALSEIKASLQTKGDSWRNLVQPGIRRVVAVSFCLAILVHVSGISVVVDYAPIIFRSAGWQISAALFSTFILGGANLLFTLVAFWLIDRWGRKPLYIVGSLGMAAVLLLLSLTVVLGHFHGLLVLFLILAYLAFFEACIGPVFWTLIPEIFPNKIRGTAMTIPVLTQWVANGVVVLFFPAAFNQIGKATTFSVLALMALLQAVFTWFFVPETKNKPLEEIEEFWSIGNIGASPVSAK